MYRDAERRKGVAERIRRLWEESGYTEQHVADTIGITVSGFQKQKQTGGVRRETAEKLAELFGSTYEYIATGREKPGETPDVLASLNGSPEERLDRIEQLVRANGDRLDRFMAEALPILAELSEPPEQEPGAEASA